MVRFDPVPFLQGQTRIAKLKSSYHSLIIGPRGLGCETNLWECSHEVRFDLRTLLYCQMSVAKLKSAYNSLSIGPRGLRCETSQ